MIVEGEVVDLSPSPRPQFYTPEINITIRRPFNYDFTPYFLKDRCGTKKN